MLSELFIACNIRYVFLSFDSIKTIIIILLFIIIFHSVRLVLSSSANILQTADVAFRVVFLLFLPCFKPLRQVPAVVLTLKTSEASAILFFQPKQLNPVPRSSRLTVHQPVEGCIFDAISLVNTKFFQIWSPVTRYGEYACAFSPSELGNYFE